MKNWYFKFFATIELNPLLVSPKIKTASGLKFFIIFSTLIKISPSLLNKDLFFKFIL